MRQTFLLLAFWLFGLSFSNGQALTLTSTAIKSQQANTSGLSFVNLNSSSPASASNGKNLSLDASGNVILTLEPSATVSYWQLTGNDLLNTNAGTVKVTNLQVGDATLAKAGMLKWTGTDLQFYDGNKWISLIGQAPLGIWVAVPGGAYCNCPEGYTKGFDSRGYTCKDGYGSSGSIVDSGQAQYYSNGNLVTYYASFCVNSVQTSYNVNQKNTQCYCVKLK